MVDESNTEARVGNAVAGNRPPRPSISEFSTTTRKGFNFEEVGDRHEENSSETSNNGLGVC